MTIQALAFRPGEHNREIRELRRALTGLCFLEHA